MDPLEFLAERPLGVISTVSADGTPHAVPIEVVVHQGSVYVWCHATSVKARNAARTGRAAIVAYKGNSFVLVRGSARVEPSAEHDEVTRMFLDKYDRTESYGNDALIRVTPEKVIARRT